MEIVFRARTRFNRITMTKNGSRLSAAAIIHRIVGRQLIQCQSKYSTTLPLGRRPLLAHHTSRLRRVICSCGLVGSLVGCSAVCICGLTLIFHVKPCETTLCSMCIHITSFIIQRTDRSERCEKRLYAVCAHHHRLEVEDRANNVYRRYAVCMQTNGYHQHRHLALI